MKEKKLKLMKYLLFGVFTCLIGVGFTGCGKDYDDEIKDLQSKLAKVTTDLGLAATTTAMNTAVAGVVDQAKNAAKEEVAKMMGSGVTVEQASKSMGELMALNAYFANDPYFAGATRTLNEVLGEAATKAGTTSVMVEGMKKLATDVAMLKNQMAVLGTVTGTGSNAQSSVIKDIQDRLDAISTGTGGGTPNYDAIAAALAANQAFMNAIIEKIGGDLNMLPVYNMITEISLVQTSTTPPFALNFGSAPVTVNKFFGLEGYVGRVEFKSNTIMSGTQSVVVRVTPANAVLTKEMISLVNSKGEGNVGDRVRVVDVKKYEGDITRAASIATGLYEITFDLSTTAGSLNTSNNAFAVAAQSNEGRHVLTDYEITLNNTGTISNVNALIFKVNGTLIDDIAGLDGTSLTERIGANNTNVPVKIGQPFEVKMESSMGNAYAYYIDVEKLNPTDADRSKITGLKKVYRITEPAKLTITDATMKGTQQKFRVYAVNYDGSETYVAGKSFYVMSDKDMPQGAMREFTASIPNALMSSLPMLANNNKLETNSVEIPYWTTSTNALIKYYDMTMTVEGLTFTVSGMYDGNGNFTAQTPNGPSNSIKTTQIPQNSDAGKIMLTGINPANLKENVVYSGTLTLRDAIQSPLAVYPVTLKKPTPTPSVTLLPNTHISNNALSNGSTAYAIGDPNTKTITIIPAPVFEGPNGVLSKAMYTYSQTATNQLFGNSTGSVVISPTTSNGVANKDGEMTLTNGYYTESPSNLQVKYNYGAFGYKSVAPGTTADPDFYVSLPDYKVKYASALAGYALSFDNLSNFAFTVGNELILSTKITLTSFITPTNTMVFTKDVIEKWIDPATASTAFSGVLTYIDSTTGTNKAITLTHVGYDANNFPKLRLSADDAAKLTQFVGRACGINISLIDRLGAKASVNGNVKITVDAVNGTISVSK